MNTPFFAEKSDSGRKTISHRIFWIAVIALFLCPFSAFAQCVTSWKGSAAGNWNVAVNWTAGVPSKNNTCINTANAAVTLNIAGATAANLTLGLSTDRLLFNNGTSLTVSGSTISNAGAILLNSVGNFTELIIGAANVTLSGGGTLMMSNNAQNIIIGALGTDTLTNQETIQGAGNIGYGRLTLVNSGTINANQTTMLIIQPSSTGFNNQGTLQVNTGDTMKITGPANSFLNFKSGTNTLTGGIYKDSGTLQIDNINIVTNAANITLTGSTSKLIDQSNLDGLRNFATNAAAGSFAISRGRNFTNLGNFTNNGTLNVGSGTKFDVNGNLTNFSGTTLTGGTYIVGGTLQFNGANIATNAANITLSGTTSKITDQVGTINALANFATNSGSFTLSGNQN